MSRRPEQVAREIFAPVVDYVRESGFGDLVANSPALLAESVTRPAFLEVATPFPDGTWRLDDKLLYPAAAHAKPRVLTVGIEDGEHMVRASIPDTHWPLVHHLIAGLCVAGVDERTRQRLHPDMRQLFDGLRNEQLLTLEEPARETAELTAAPVTFCGHNTVVVRGTHGSVVVDPWLPARSDEYPDFYQPLQLSELGKISAVLITHSHPDHLDPASLLRLPPEIPIVVPEVDRETLLAADFGLRLRELGFTNVMTLGWTDSRSFDDVTVTALPFYGEQPTDAWQLHPEVRNSGNTYRIAAPDCTAVVLADSGRDSRGDASSIGLNSLDTHGKVDVVFSGYRGWATYPVQLLFSSVAHFIYFVPRSMWGCRMQLMTGTDAAVDVAERFGASILVPYADGGAPWFWNMGLGPRLDEQSSEIIGFDPFPERVAEAARARTSMPGGMSSAPIEVVIMRPGESLTGVRDQPVRVTVDGHRWPW